MTGALTYAASEAHISDLHAAATKRRSSSRKARGKKGRAAIPGLLRPRRPLAA